MRKMILTINGGSSSIKCALYPADGSDWRLKATLDRIGHANAALRFIDLASDEQGEQSMAAADYAQATSSLLGWLDQRIDMEYLLAVGHRVVHGLDQSEPQVITSDLVRGLRQIQSYDPDHLPGELAIIEQFQSRWPDLHQVACFDTAFHRSMPRVARMLPLPRRFDRQGVRRYGFHGLSYEYLMEELARLAGPEVARGRVLLAHLGNGASMAAVRNGRSIDTTMGFTPAAGLVMGTRCGDLDPGAAWYIIQTERMTADRYNELITHESGLLGVSEISGDMRVLLECEGHDERAAEAVALFCYQARKWIGALTAALGGLDTLVFSGGIGEHSGDVRARICQGLEFLGVEIDEAQNQADAPVISTTGGRATVRVIATDEQRMIARGVRRCLVMAGAEGPRQAGAVSWPEESIWPVAY